VSDSPILKIAVNVPLSREFDYLPPLTGPGPLAGCRVRVPFGRGEQVGMVLGLANESAVPLEKMKRCTGILDDTPLLSAADLWLIRFTSDYYHHPIGEVVAAALPTLLRHGKPMHPTIIKVIATELGNQADLETLRRRAPRQAELLEALLDAGGDGLETDLLTEILPVWRRTAKGLADKGLITTFAARAETFDEKLAIEKVPGPDLNADQQQALSVMRSSDQFAAYLLDGVTGSRQNRDLPATCAGHSATRQTGTGAGTRDRVDTAACCPPSRSPGACAGAVALRAHEQRAAGGLARGTICCGTPCRWHPVSNFYTTQEPGPDHCR